MACPGVLTPADFQRRSPNEGPIDAERRPALAYRDRPHPD